MEMNSNNFGEMVNYSVTFTNNGFYVGDFPPIDSSITTTTNIAYPVFDYYWNWWYPNCEVRYEKSKVDIAFKIMKVLADKKIIDANKLTVGKFIELVNDLAKEL